MAITLDQALEKPILNLGKDIKMMNNDIVIAQNNDFSIIKYKENLAQAIKNRLQTVLTEMRVNLNYGSKLKLMMGIPRSDVLKIEIANEIEFTLLQEPRIRKVENIIIIFDEVNKAKVNVSLDVLPIEAPESMNMIYEIFV